MAITGEAYGGSMLVPGWTNQNLGVNVGQLTSNIEAGSGPAGVGQNPGQNAYIAWTLIPEDSITTNSHTSTNGYLVRILPGGGGVVSHLDVVGTTITACTNAVFGLYSGASLATGPLAWTADVHASLAVGMNSFTFNGASSPSGVQLQANQTYWVYYELTFGTASTLAGSTGATATSMNPNLTASTTFANNAMVLSTSAPTSLTATTALNPTVNWANTNLKAWVGLR